MACMPEEGSQSSGVQPDKEEQSEQTDRRTLNLRLTYASRSARVELVKLLLRAGADPDGRVKDDLTPLHAAAIAACPATVQALLEAGAQVDPEDKDGTTPLQWATNQPRAGLAEDGCDARYLEVARLLLQAGANPNHAEKSGRTALHAALRTGMVQLLLDYGADANCQDRDRRTPLHGIASMQSQCPLSIQDSPLEMARALIRGGADVNLPNKEGRTVLLCLAMHYYDDDDDMALLAMARALLEAGADVHYRDNAGKTALHHAAKFHSCQALLRLLLEAGAEVNAADKDQRTPLFSLYDARSVALLLQAGANVNAKDKLMKTPLSLAVVRGDTEVVQLLLDAGADVHVEGGMSDGAQTGWTLLKTAACTGNAEIMAELVLRGADASSSVQTDERLTALEMAQESGHTELADWLRKAGASEGPSVLSPKHLQPGSYASVGFPAGYSPPGAMLQGGEAKSSAGKAGKAKGGKLAHASCLLLPPCHTLWVLWCDDEAVLLPDDSPEGLDLQEFGFKPAAPCVLPCAVALPPGCKATKCEYSPDMLQEQGIRFPLKADIELPLCLLVLEGGRTALQLQQPEFKLPAAGRGLAGSGAGGGSSGSSSPSKKSRKGKKGKAGKAAAAAPPPAPQPKQQVTAQACTAGSPLSGSTACTVHGEQACPAAAATAADCQHDNSSSGSECEHHGHQLPPHPWATDPPRARPAGPAADPTLLYPVRRKRPQPASQSPAQCPGGGQQQQGQQQQQQDRGQQPGQPEDLMRQHEQLELPAALSPACELLEPQADQLQPQPHLGRSKLPEASKHGDEDADVEVAELMQLLGLPSAAAAAAATAASEAESASGLAQGPQGVSGVAPTSFHAVMPLPIPIPIPQPLLLLSGIGCGSQQATAATPASSSMDAPCSSSHHVAGSSSPSTILDLLQPLGSSCTGASATAATVLARAVPGPGARPPPPQWFGGLLRVFEPSRATNSYWWWLEGSGQEGRGQISTQDVQGPTWPQCMMMAMSRGEVGPSTLVCGAEGDVLQPPPLALFQPLGQVLQMAAAGGSYRLATRGECAHLQ